MIDYKEMINNKSIDKLSFLLNYYHLINLSETELVLIMHIEILISNNYLVTSKNLSNKMNCSKEVIDKTIKSLSKRKYIIFDMYSSNNTIDISNVYLRIIEKLDASNINSIEKMDENKTGNLIDIFSKEFQKPLTPFEIEEIKDWSNIYSDELIIYALKEAVKMNKLSLKYIEKIIIQQARILNE